MSQIIYERFTSVFGFVFLTTFCPSLQTWRGMTTVQSGLSGSLQYNYYLHKNPQPTSQRTSHFVPVQVTLGLFDGLALGMVLDGVVFLVERLAD